MNRNVHANLAVKNLLCQDNIIHLKRYEVHVTSAVMMVQKVL